jgi:CCR4-NOT transcriptional regulation complex NOT5 subunit
MAKINLYIPEPQPVYTQDSIRQINQALETLKDQLNFSFQEELKQELERFTWYNIRYGC